MQDSKSILENYRELFSAIESLPLRELYCHSESLSEELYKEALVAHI
jgi:sulfur relay (sulfurtransferase) DsrF/TusC family protein